MADYSHAYSFKEGIWFSHNNKFDDIFVKMQTVTEFLRHIWENTVLVLFLNLQIILEVELILLVSAYQFQSF